MRRMPHAVRDECNCDRERQGPRGGRNMIRLTIDGKPVEAAEGTSILDVAASIGIEIPTLCHLPGKDPLTSCMVCLVRVNGQAKLSPACATKVTEGMTIASETPEIRKARQTAIELLLSEHAG